MIEIIKRETPQVEIGNFTRPIQRKREISASSM
jgi:hypothetical protein